MLKIGWSKRDVSTERPVMINGQMHIRISKGVLDPILLNCLVIENGKDLAVFLSGDFVSGNNVLDIIRSKVSALRPEFPVKKILFNVTHTHCGPMIITGSAQEHVPNDGIDIYPPDEYRNFMTDMAAEAILEAYDNRKEGAIAYGYGYAVVSHSRRTVYFDDFSKRGNSTAGPKNLYVHGHAVMYGNTNDDQFSGYEGGADHYVNLMYTFDSVGKLTGAIINVPCPSQNSEQEYHLTADYWHDVRQILTEKYGDIGILSQCAAAGDLAPRILHYNKAEARRFQLKYADAQIDKRFDSAKEKLRRMDIAQRICEAFDEVLSWAGKELIRDAEVKHSVRDISVPRRLVAKELYEDALAELPKLEQAGFVHTDDPTQDYINNTIRTSGISRYKGIIRRYEEQQADPNTKVELHTIRIGDIAFASNPFELYIDYQHRIQARSPFTQTFIVQLCAKPDGNYSAGYLATERAVANVGYSAAIYDNQVAPEGGTKLVEETLKDLHTLINFS